MVSIIEIANMAGVSPATVSRAINNNTVVSKSAQSRIQEAMNKVGYSLDLYRKRKISPVTSMKTIAFLVLSNDVLQDYSSSFRKITRVVSSTTVKMGANMIHATVDSLANLPPSVANKTIDGLILAGSCNDEQVMKMIAGIPKVWLSSHRKDGAVLPLSGNEQIGRLAAEYLYSRGHKKIAFLNGFSEHLSMRTRSDFFEFYAKNKGIETELFTLRDEKIVFDSLSQIRSSLELLVNRWIKSKERATGLFIPLDLQAAMCYEIFASYGIKIGKDVDIIACDNDEAALMGLVPKPATIEIGAEAMGFKAVQELLWKIDNPDDGGYGEFTVAVEPKLVEGGIVFKP